MISIRSLWEIALGGVVAGVVLWLIFGVTTGLACGFGMLSVALYGQFLSTGDGK